MVLGRMRSDPLQVAHQRSDLLLEVTGLRNPYAQIENFRKGLLSSVIDTGPDGKLIRKSGIMTIVLRGGWVRQGDNIDVDLPDPPFLPLERV